MGEETLQPHIAFHSFSNPEELYRTAVEHIRVGLKSAHKSPRALLLPGGQTRAPIFEAIRSSPFRAGSAAYVAYTDERHVPPDSKESNYGNTLAARPAR